MCVVAFDQGTGTLYMKLIGLSILRAGQKRHAVANKRLEAWKTEVEDEETVWTSFQSIRQHFPSADKVGKRYVFDIGIRFRLVAEVNFVTSIVTLRWFGTHAEYDRIKVEEV
jgi:mRNA interferase HigB